MAGQHLWMLHYLTFHTDAERIKICVITSRLNDKALMLAHFLDWVTNYKNKPYYLLIFTA